MKICTQFTPVLVKADKMTSKDSYQQLTEYVGILKNLDVSTKLTEEIFEEETSLGKSRFLAKFSLLYPERSKMWETRGIRRYASKINDGTSATENPQIAEALSAFDSFKT